MLTDVWTKFRLFQKPANFDARLTECERTLNRVKGQAGMLEIGSVEHDVVQSQLEQCMVGNGIPPQDRLGPNHTVSTLRTFWFFGVQQKLYKVLSEVKGEVETVIKTGRQIVQRQQTEQPKDLDDRVTALKLLYNQLGSQVRTHTHIHTHAQLDEV